MTKIIIKKNQSGWNLDGQLNPTVAGLATYKGAPTSLEPLIKEIEKHENKINPSKEFFISICREAAARHSATVKVDHNRKDTSVTPYRIYSAVTFTSSTGETFDVEIVSISDKICPACNVDPGFTRPHNVIPASIWKKVIKNVLNSYGVPFTLSDKYIAQILAAGTSTKGPATTEDKQCRKCEDNQDKKPGPYSLFQRRQGQLAGYATTISHPSVTGVSGGDLFTGSQFKDANVAQIEQLTKDIIDRVIDKISQVLSKVPVGHVLHSNITNNPLTETAFLNQIRSDALSEAKASPSAYPP